MTYRNLTGRAQRVRVDELDEMVLDVVRAWPGQWFSADLAQRQVRARLGLPAYSPEAPGIMRVARSLARLAVRGEVERIGRNGAWTYRV